MIVQKMNVIQQQDVSILASIVMMIMPAHQILVTLLLDVSTPLLNVTIMMHVPPIPAMKTVDVFLHL
jgi:hypothetical protein